MIVKIKRDANKRFIKNIPNTLLLLTKTLFQKHKNIFDPLWIGERKICNATNPIFKNIPNILLLLTKTMV